MFWCSACWDCEPGERLTVSFCSQLWMIAPLLVCGKALCFAQYDADYVSATANPVPGCRQSLNLRNINRASENDMSLTEKTCVPCRGGIPPLTENEAAVFAREVPNWRLTHGSTRIERAFKFDDFTTSLAFVNQVSALAEEEGHHPDLAFGWGYANVELYTHKIKGLHENDFIMAAKIDRIAAG